MLETLAARFDASVLDGSQEGARIRAIVEGPGQETSEWHLLFEGPELRVDLPTRDARCDAMLSAHEATWSHIAHDLHGGMDAYRSGRLNIRHNLHLGVAFLAATSGEREPSHLRFDLVATRSGELSTVSAGEGPPVIFVHGLGATKISFLPSVAALAGSFRTISVDLPGFGDSHKPIRASYTPPFFARSIIDLMDALSIERASIIGNSMGGRVALELGLRHPERVASLGLVCPSLAWKKQRPWAPFVRLLRPELGLLQVTPRVAVEQVVRRIIPGARSGWVQAGVDEFLRAYTTARGRHAFYAAARQIYLEEPHGSKGFWNRLRSLSAPSLFIWGEQDRLVPIEFAAHVQHALPAARHLELDCGHVPQLERSDETHAALMQFLTETVAGATT